MDLKHWQKGALLLISLGIGLLFLSGFSLQNSQFAAPAVVSKPPSVSSVSRYFKISPEKLKLYEAGKQIEQLEKENDILVRFVKMDYRRILDRIWSSYGDEIKKYAAKYQLDPNLLAAVIAVESRGRRRATASHGEKGLMQLRPLVCKKMGVTDPFDPSQNIRAGAGYLKQLLQEFNKDVTLALAAYNAGPTIVRHYKGMPPWIYTKYYVRKVLYLSQAT